MIHHAKLFVRRLAYMPWLLAVGLVLGWTGEAAAQELPTLLVGNGTGTEGGNVTFTVVVSPPLGVVDGEAETATVDYVARVEAGNTASLATDFTSIPMTLTITGAAAPGTSTATIDIAAVDDALDEPDETFTLELSRPSGVTFSGGGTTLTATGTIEDNDGPVTVNVAATATPAVVAEGPNTEAQFTVTLGTGDAPTPSGQVVMVDYEASASTGASADDFVATEGTLTFAVDETSKIVPVPIVDDDIHEVSTEGITLTLTLVEAPAVGNAALGTATATVTITDNEETPEFNVMAGDPADEGTFATFTVSLSGASSEQTTVNYTVVGTPTDTDLTATEGTDFTATTTAATLNFAAGETSKTVSVPIVADGIDEGDETFELRLADPAAPGGTLVPNLGDMATATGTIRGHLPSLSVFAPAEAVVEAEGAMAEFTVTLSKEATADVTVTYNTSLEPGDTAEQADFTAATNLTATITVGETSTKVSVTILDDDDIEENETFTLTLSNPSAGAMLGDMASAQATIADDDKPSLSVFAPAEAVAEGEDVVFTVALSDATGQDVTVEYEISIEAEDSAHPDDFENFMSETGTLTITAGQTSVMVPPVETVNDDLVEDDETFTLTLSNPSGAVLGDMLSAKATISSEDMSPLPSLSVAVADATEGGAVDITVTLSAEADADVTVAFDISTESGGDFATTSGMVTITAGDTEGMESVATVDDNDVEGSETFKVTLSNPSANAVLGDPSSATGTLTDNDLPSLSVAVGSATEGGAVGITVTLSAATDVEVTVDYKVSIESDDTAGPDDFDDFSEASGTMTIAVGETTEMVSVMTVDDDLLEALKPETFTVTLENPMNAVLDPARSSAKGSITDNELPLLSVAVAGATEGEAVGITVTLSAATDVEVTVDFAISTASGDDFAATPRTVTIDAGSLTGMASVMTVDDDDVEGSETFTVTLENPMNAVLDPAASSATGTLTDNDLPSLSVAVGSATEGGAVGITVTLSAATDVEVTVDYKVSIESDDTAGPDDFDDFSEASGTMTIAVGETTEMVSVMTVDDDLLEALKPETFTVTLENPMNAVLDPAASSAKGSITDNELPLLSVAVADATEGEAVGITVTLSAATNVEVTVDFAISTASSDDFETTSGTVSIDAGSLTGMASVATVDDDDVEGGETFTVTLENPMNAVLDPAASSATGTIADNDLPLLSVAVGSATEGGAVGITVTLSAATDVEVTVDFEVSIESDDTASPDDFANFREASGTVSIAAGSLTGTASVMTAPDDIIEPDETFTVTLSNPMNAVLNPIASSAQGTITDNDLPLLSVADGSAVEGEDVEFTVTLSVATDEAVTVNYATSVEDDDTATQADFKATSGTLTIAAGATEATVSVETVDDAEEEEPETFTLTLSDPSNAELSATMSSAQGSITDNESPTPSVSDASAVEGEDVEFTVTLSKASGVDQEFSYGISIEADDTASPDDFVDFVGGSGTLTIAAGATEATVSVATRDDNRVEEDETFTLTVGGLTAQGTITDNDVRVPPPTGAITLTVSPASVRENAGTATEVSVTASVDSPTDAAVTVSLALSGTAKEGTDYTISGTQSITIAAGETSDKTALTFTPINDAVYEGDETILITGTGTGYTSGSTRVTLIDDDEPSTPVSSGGGGGSPPPPPPPPSPSFDDKTIAAQFYIQGTAIDPLVFPIAQDGTKPLTYGLSQTSTAQAAIDPLTGLPDSLAFDPKTRTLTGTPATPLPATEFSYTVIDADGRTASLCFDITIYALIGPPTPPTDLTVAFDADGKLVLHWKEPARNGGYDLTSYEVQYQKTTSASWRRLAIRVPANHPTKTYTIGSLQADAEYNVRVRAYNLNPLPELSVGEWAMASTDETAMPDEIAAGTGEPAAAGAVCKPGLGDLLATEDAGDGEPSGDGDDGEPTAPSAPGAPTNLTATPGDGKLLLRWKEPTQTGGFDLTFYDLQYQKTTSTSWISVAIRIPANYRTKTYSIGSLQNGVAYNVRVRVHNLNPDPELSLSAWTTATATPTEDAAAKQAASFELAAAYPNPFNPSTTISYALPQAADVRLDIYNVMGQRVRTLVAAHQPAGYYAVEWKATDDSGHTLSSGVYFYHLQAGAFRATKRMLLMR